METQIQVSSNNAALIYPKYLVDIFNKYNISIDELPILDLGDRGGHTDYIDFVMPEEMTSPIMKFTDKFRRPGLIFRLKGKSDDKIIIHNTAINIKDICTTLAIFKRYTESYNTVWSFGWGGSNNLIAYTYSKYHEKDHIHNAIDECSECPFSSNTINPKLIDNLIGHTDTLFELI